ncbi:Vhc1p NDAI_0F01990 [Naumovozyma dairenensis CBS 421]|uniref:Amino acid permease/ SLC12A domain-containing protein n=1 Tax=Naumovozyma dairenensis (strain ATCC 10597 / BCRC 20456 / CBS 421 / NBRC 0211 / NRRL Y-12639) TaxID=1071378 RepID=G0WCK6_NAUDC|nr:hypothetical protein NDAI_0F01990 [Naumovozyma dairenensis CBS 421]CCD25517.1 hypothetical protein NDAI_0F01990 [Naumovozyma dairenensis CBS 421]
MATSRFYDIPGTHRLSDPSNENSSLISSSRPNKSYYNYQATPKGQKKSSKYDPENPHKHKLGTYDGVFIPTSLNVLSILMFLRFGFILGQLGLLCTLGLLLLSYFINLLTTLSISAISTNGTVRGGGAYYMISRCLGPEFGGSIGVVFFLGQVLNSGMNALGLVEPLLYNLGKPSADSISSAALFALLPRGYWYELTYASVILCTCLIIALVGSQTVSRAGNILFFVLVSSIVSIPLSVLFQKPFENGKIIYSGISWETFQNNLFPHFTKGAAGSILKKKETFNNLFGVFFPATAGIFAGAGMSSELRKPSKSIPKGTLWGLLFTFSCYTVVVISMSCTIPRKTLYNDVQVIQSVSAVQWIIFLGEMATSLFSIIVGMLGAAYVLEAISKDCIFPGLSVFNRNPIYTLIFTWLLTQICLFSDVNKIATFITLTFLMTFIVMNMACFLLEISAAPNFRPSFNYFNRYTAFVGAISSILAMIIVDGVTASALMLGMVILFLLIHYVSPPKPWGDVSQSLIYHQVRKYLLRLRQDNIKYWRPQILLFVDNPRTSWNLIRFCNHLKKGGLYILGHVTVTDKFQDQINEMKIQQRAWVKIRDMLGIKAFVQIGMGPTLPWGVRNVFIGAGLGGMKPNITVLGFFDLKSYHRRQASDGGTTDTTNHNNFTTNNANNAEILHATRNTQTNDINIEIPSLPPLLPTDECKNEEKIKVQQWVEIIEDLSILQSNIAIAHGFGDLILPTKDSHCSKKRIIDLYPIQMCGVINTSEHPSMASSNFDTYTLILQLGAILVTVPEWKDTHTLRVILFVEKELDRGPEIDRMTKLLGVLRIEAEVLVVSLDQFRVYNTIVKGDTITFDYVNSVLGDNAWWMDLTEARATSRPKRRFSLQNDLQFSKDVSKKEKYKVSKLQRLGVVMSMTSSMPAGNILTPSISDESDVETDISFERDRSDFLKGSPDEANTKSTLTEDKPKSKVKTVGNKPVFSSDTLPKTKVLEEGNGDKPTLVPISEDSMNSTVNDSKSRRPILPDLSPCCSRESLLTAMANLSFNDLPSRPQHLILNDMMTQLSGGSDLIFSTLPIPALGTHTDPEASLQYIEDLDLWLEGLPPTMLINSQTMTVTTAL